MKKILMLVYPSFAEFEITVATSVLRNDYVVDTVGLTKDIVKSETGLQVKPHYELSDICVDDYEGMIIPGGDVVHLKDSEGLCELVRQLYKKEKLIAAICAGPFVFANAGVLNQHPYTVTLNYRELDCFSKEHFVYEDIVQHKNIITAQGHAFVEFGLVIADYFGVNAEHKCNFYRGKRNIVMERVLQD
ncbi:4-methyl-5(B-hydroxyethyl)-thiazole monophosphate biosynthesis protein [Bacillus manliponensis]|uniref:4-methyl-5(B-hydroxyethyl)-thiazole monophosphate biosynthesis protein n=1 Tax=Bacillus manliponensis TaxID=574376 RepID=A0A073JXC0_9BACI|nr:DJ-1/PfpI family protein [Bacillus manliponensis]KEK18857.1 4-methyl-5(B-hydroxyethyl)-thiazole monophosphate biosynthesis protein [Bacillus manliponensis]